MMCSSLDAVNTFSNKSQKNMSQYVLIIRSLQIDVIKSWMSGRNTLLKGTRSCFLYVRHDESFPSNYIASSLLAKYKVFVIV